MKVFPIYHHLWMGRISTYVYTSPRNMEKSSCFFQVMIFSPPCFHVLRYIKWKVKRIVLRNSVQTPLKSLWIRSGRIFAIITMPTTPSKPTSSKVVSSRGRSRVVMEAVYRQYEQTNPIPPSRIRNGILAKWY